MWMIGIGGGMVLGPILLEIDIMASVAAATSAFLILLSSTMSSIQFLLIGRVRFDFAISLFCIGLVSSAVGVKLLHRLVQRTGKESLIVFSIVLVIVMSNGLLVVSGIVKLVADIQNDSEGLRFSKPCSG